MKKKVIIRLLAVILLSVAMFLVGYLVGKDTCEKCSKIKKYEKVKNEEKTKKENEYLNMSSYEDCVLNNLKECYIYKDINFSISLKLQEPQNDMKTYSMYINRNKVKEQFSDANYPYITEIIEKKYVIIKTELTYRVYDLNGNNIIDFKDGLKVYNVEYKNDILYVKSNILLEGFYYDSLEDLCLKSKDFNNEYYEVNRTLKFNKETGKFEEPVIESTIDFNDLAKKEFNRTCD